jgi:hypothetical protein
LRTTSLPKGMSVDSKAFTLGCFCSCARVHLYTCVSVLRCVQLCLRFCVYVYSCWCKHYRSVGVAKFCVFVLVWYGIKCVFSVCGCVSDFGKCICLCCST